MSDDQPLDITPPKRTFKVQDNQIVPVTPSLIAPPSGLNLNTRKELNKSGVLYVVMDAECTTVMQIPGTSLPFSTKSRKYAEYIAREAKGCVQPILDAMRLVATSPCNLPPTHPQYVADKKAPKLNYVPKLT